MNLMLSMNEFMHEITKNAKMLPFYRFKFSGGPKNQKICIHNVWEIFFADNFSIGYTKFEFIFIYCLLNFSPQWCDVSVYLKIENDNNLKNSTVDSYVHATNLFKGLP